MRGLFLVVLIGALAARADADELAIPGLDARDLRGDALVWEDATFYLEPWHGGQAVRLQTFGHKRRDEVGRVIPVRIVSSTMRRFVEIELRQDRGCAARTVTADSRVEALRLFVKREDLAPVLVEPFAASHADGTRIRISTGVPVMPTRSGLYAVTVGANKLRLAIPHGSVGWVYKPGRVADETRPSGQLVGLDRGATAMLDGRPFQVGADWRARKPAKSGGTVHLPWSSRCIEVVIAVPASSLRAVSRGGGGSGWGTIGVHRPARYIPRGAPLFTPGGRAAGIAGEVIAVDAPIGETACFDARLTLWRHEPYVSDTRRTFKLCAPARLVERDPEVPLRPAPSSISADPTATPPDVARPPETAKRTAAGVWYRVLRAGKGGPKPTPTSRVTVHYAGWTTDGRLFDASYTRKRPAEFPLQAVIPGWTDGLQVMSVGDKVRFWIPEELAYKNGPRTPKGMLVFDIELLAIK